MLRTLGRGDTMFAGLLNWLLPDRWRDSLMGARVNHKSASGY